MPSTQRAPLRRVASAPGQAFEPASPRRAHPLARLPSLRRYERSAARAHPAGVDGADQSLYWADRANASVTGGSGYAKRDTLHGTSGVYALDTTTRQPIGTSHPAVLFSDLAHSTRSYGSRDALASRRARTGADGSAAENAGSYFSVAECNEARELLALKFERIAKELEDAGEKRVPRRAPRPVPKKRR